MLRPNLVRIHVKFHYKNSSNVIDEQVAQIQKIKGLWALIGVLAKAQPSMGNNPMVGATVAVAVAVENASK